jgi:hypothetical protein
MARNKRNMVIAGLSGMLGGQLILRQVGNHTIVTRAPRPSSKPPTIQQQQFRSRFGRAVAYATAAIKDEATRAVYGQRAGSGQSAYHLAIADFLHAPVIHAIGTEDYTGQPGSTLTARVTDNFKVAGVRVRIEPADGSPGEEGPAVQQKDGLTWVYTAQAAVYLPGCRITVTATDLPGNVTVVQQVL